MSKMIKKILLSYFKKHMEIAAKHPRIWEYRPIASYLGRMKTFVLSQCATDFVKLDGRSMHLPKNEFLHLILFEHDGFDTKVVRKLVNKGNNVLILGANIGYWTCLIAEHVGSSGKIFAFEPSPDNFKFLKKNVEINGYKNVTLEEKAVSNRSYQTQLYLSEGGGMDNRIYDTKTNRQSINIEVVKLDEYFQDNPIEFDFIKSDIQGADFAAVEGMYSVIKRSSNINFIIEFAPKKAKEYGSDPNRFIDYFGELGYDFYEIWWYDKKLRHISSEQLKDYAKNDIDTNLVLLQKSSSKENLKEIL